MGNPVGACIVAIVFSMIIVLGSVGTGLDVPSDTGEMETGHRGSYEVPAIPDPPDGPDVPKEEASDPLDEDGLVVLEHAIVVPILPPYPKPGPEPEPVVPGPIMPTPTWPEPVDPIGSGKVKLDLPCPPWTDMEERELAMANGITVPKVNGPRLDVVFCLDTTGSMGDEIQVAKEAILDIAAEVADGYPVPEVRYGLVIFRDIGDEYVTKVFDFMTAEELAVVLQGVEARRGGDYPESVSEALHRSVHDVSWDLENAACSIYLIGDAPPHTDYDNGFDHIIAATDAAERGIVINAIGCSGIQDHEKEFMEVVDITGGIFVYLEYDHGVSGRGDVDTHCGSSLGGFDGSSVSENASYDHSVSSYSGDGSEGSDDDGDYDCDLDDVLMRMLKACAEDEGVKYDD